MRAFLDPRNPARHSISPITPKKIQTKLACHARWDSSEQEADRVSEQVAQPGPGRGPVRIRSAAPGAGGQTAVPPIVDDVLGSPGHPLGASTRDQMESRFGHRFGDVKVHTDSIAARSADAIDALAYTVGNHVVFGAGRYAPATPQGRRLLAHELTHVVQQRGAPPAVQRAPKKPPLQSPDAPVPRLPTKVVPGSTHLSRVAQAYRVDNPGLPDGANLVVVEYSTEKSGRRTQVLPNRPGVSHSEHEMDEFLRSVRRQERGEVTVHEIYSERQPCGPADRDCEGLLLKRYPGARTTFGYGYQETEAPARDSRAARTRSNIDAAHERLARSRQLEWDFSDQGPPPHFQRNEPGPVSPRPRRGGGGRLRFSPGRRRWGAVSGEAQMIVSVAVEKLIAEPQNNKLFEDEVKRLQPEIDQLISDQSEAVLALQRRNEIAYANITLLLESTSADGVSFLSRVALHKVAVSEWSKQRTDWKRKGVSFAAVAERAAGLTGVLSTYSEPLSLHPDLVDEATDRIETRLQELDRDIARTFSPALRAPFEKEHQVLQACLARLLTPEGVTSIGMLAGVCTDLIRAPRR